MKILVVSEEFSRGGLETQIKTYYDNLPSDVEMVFAFQRYTKEVVLENAKIYTGFHFSFNDTIKEFCEDVERLVDIINTEKIDVIHLHPFYSFFATLFASQLTKTKLIHSFHGFGSFNFLNSVTIASIFKYAFEIGAVAQLHTVSNIGKQCFEDIGYKNSVLIPNAVDTEYFKTIEYVNNKKWAIISRIDSDKISEIKQLLLNKATYGMEAIDIYGSGAEIESLENFIAENGLTETVQFKGYCNDIYNTLNQKYNGIAGIGRVVLEGISMGMPVFLIGYGKLTGFINQKLFDEILPLNFTNTRINSTNYEIPSAEELVKLQDNIKNVLSIKTLIKTYINSIQSAESIYMENLRKFYLELKALSENPEFSNRFYVNDRTVYSLAHNYIQSHSVDNSLNNMFIATDFCYYKYDELSAQDYNLQNLLQAENQALQVEIQKSQAENQRLQTEIDALKDSINILQQKEQYRFNQEQAYFDRRSKKLYVRIGRKIKRILKISR